MSVSNTITVDDLVGAFEKLDEIQRLLGEAYEHYYRLSDGYGKSSEGAISLSLNIPPFFWNEDAGYGKPHIGVSIYSYVFGPHRNHDFSSIDDALDTVSEWHADEMAREYDENGDVIGAWDE